MKVSLTGEQAFAQEDLESLKASTLYKIRCILNQNLLDPDRIVDQNTERLAYVKGSEGMVFASQLQELVRQVRAQVLHTSQKAGFLRAGWDIKRFFHGSDLPI